MIPAPPVLFGGGIGTPSWFPLNRRWGYLGDSITNGSAATNAIYAFPAQSNCYAGELHNPTILQSIKGTPGNTSAQMLARAATDLPPTLFDGIVVLAGTNDSSDSNAVPVATYAANMTAIVQTYPGKVVILVTPPPRGIIDTPSPAEQQRIVEYGQWINDNATSLGYLVADAYAALVDGLGYLDPIYDSGDGIHPNNLGHQQIAALVGAQMLASQPYRTSMVDALRGKALNNNPLMNGAIGAGSPSGWTGGTPASSGTAETLSIAVRTPDAFQQAGQLYRSDLNALADSVRRRAQGVSTGFSTGDKLLFIGKMKTTVISGDWEAANLVTFNGEARMQIVNGGTGANLSLSAMPSRSVALQRQFAATYTVASGVTNILLETTLAAPTGVRVQNDALEFAAFNLTALRLATRIFV